MAWEAIKSYKSLGRHVKIRLQNSIMVVRTQAFVFEVLQSSLYKADIASRKVNQVMG